MVNINENKGKYFENTLWMLGNKIVKIISELTIGIWLARFLQPENFGLLNYVISYVLIFSILATLGLDNIVVKHLVKNEKSSTEILGTSFLMKCIGFITLLLALNLSFFFIDLNEQIEYFIIIIGLSYFFNSFNLIDLFFQSKVESKYSSIVNIIVVLISSMLKVGFILLELDLEYFIYIYVFESFTLAILYILMYSYVSKGNICRWNFNRSFSLVLIKESWPLIFSSFMVLIYLKIDQLMIKPVLGSAELGIYSVAVRLSEAWYFFPMVVGSSLFPAVITAHKRSRDEYLNSIQQLYDFLFWLSFFVSIIVTFFGSFFIIFFYGEEYSDAIWPLSINIWSSLFVSLSIIKSKTLVIENKTRINLYTSIVSASSNVLLNYFLIPIYGINGAAFSTLISQFISAYLINFFIKDIYYHTFLMHQLFNIPRVLISFKNLFNS